MSDAPAGPPPPPAPAPPPPPPAPGANITRDPDAVPQGMTRLQQVKPGTKMRPLHWSKVPNARLEASVWKQADDLILLINGPKLKEMYGMGKEKGTIGSMFSGRSAQKKGASNALMMDADKARVVGIFLSSGKVEAKEVASKLYETDKNQRLHIDHLVALSRIQPDKEERRLYGDFKGNVSQLQDVDRFMYELCKIDNLNNLIEIQLLLQEFPNQLVGFPPLLENLTSACKEIMLPGFKRLLEYLRAIGNYLNAGTNKGNCYGFRISSLNQITTVKSPDKNYTLMNYIVDTILPREREIGKLPKQMGYVKEMAGVSVVQVSNEVDMLDKELGKIINVVKEIMGANPGPMQQNFAAKVLKHCQAFKVELAYLKKMKQDMLDKFKEVAIYLGENPKDDISEVFTNISQFLTELDVCIEKTAKAQAILKQQKEKAEKVEKIAADGMKSPNINRESSGELPGLPLSTSSSSGSSGGFKSYTAPPAVSTATAGTIKLSKPTRKGWLEKSAGGPLMRFEKRWFEVDDSGTLYHYKKEGGKALGSTYLRGVQPSLDESHPGMIVFFVDGKKTQLLAKTRDDAMGWLEVLCTYA